MNVRHLVPAVSLRLLSMGSLILAAGLCCCQRSLRGEMPHTTHRP